MSARLVAATVSAVFVAASVAGVADAASRTPKPAVDPPLATSLATAAGTWASVPMGHLDQRLNTFWQLFFEPARSSGTWKDVATRLGIATNGGFLLSGSSGQPLLVGIRPSNQLRYTALVASSDGRSWNPRPPADGNVTSLASGSRGELVVLQDASGGRVLASAPGGAWRTVVTAASLRASVGRRCAPLVLTAVSWSPSGEPLVGASCARAGSTGVFNMGADGRWRSVGPSLPSKRTRVEVLSLQTAGGQPGALLALTSGSRTKVVDGFIAPVGRWHLSPPLALGSDVHLVAMGSQPGGGEFVLDRLRSGEERLAVSQRPGGSWSYLANPPTGTETVAFPVAGRVDALSVAGTVMTDWVLRSGASSWAKHSSYRVRILFGSSTL